MTALVVDTHRSLLGGDATAVFSPDRTYRYALTRTWDDSHPPVVWIMLNPSTADAFKVDPTIRRCSRFSRSWGAGGLVVLNLFALRSTDPRNLRRHPDPVGPDNDLVIARHLFDIANPVICAWGTHGGLHARDHQVMALLQARHVHPLCLGATNGGAPRHPLYVPNGTAATTFRVVG